MITRQLKTWLDTPPDKADYQEGALLLLRLSSNKVMYANIMADIHRYHDFIREQLARYYDFRISQVTHREVRDMELKVKKIVNASAATPDKTSAEAARSKGRRADHSSLPPDIQDKYVLTHQYLLRIRELHLKLRSLSGRESTCPDSDRYPFLKEIIALDKKMHQAWLEYDSYQIQ